MNIHGIGIFADIVFTLKDYAYDSIPSQQIFFDLTTGVNEIQSVSNFSIFPNPFSHSTSIKFNLLKSEKVSIKIFDLNGRLIKTLADNTFEEGEHQVELNADEVNPGIYFLQIQTGQFSKTEKLIVTK
jgi:hypothetical protein